MENTNIINNDETKPKKIIMKHEEGQRKHITKEIKIMKNIK